MSHSSVIRPIALGLSLMLAAAAASAAEDQGWYFGLNAGQSEYDISKAELDTGTEDGFLSRTSTLDDTDTAWSLAVGYRFTPHIALEAQYLDLGTAEYRLRGTNLASSNAVLHLDFKSSGFAVAGVGTLPLGSRFDLHARLGAYFSDTRGRVEAASAGNRARGSASDTSEDLFYGAGAAFRITPNWVLSLDWNGYKIGENDRTSEEDVSTITLGITLRI